MNALAVREWLDQRELLSATPTSPTNVQSVATAPLPMHSELKHKQTTRRIIRRSGTGIALILFVLAGLFIVGFSVNQFAPALLASLPTFHSSPGARLAADLPTGFAGNATATLVPTRVPTPTPTSTTSSAFQATLQPSHLAHQNCSSEPLGYRCTLTLTLYTQSKGVITWSASSKGLPVMFNPASGKNHAGEIIQVIAYIQGDSSQKGQLVFSVSFSSTTIQVVTNWDA